MPNRRLNHCLAASLGALALLVPAMSQASAVGPGENLTFDCRYLGLPVGKGQIQVGSPTSFGNVRAAPIVVFGKTDALFVLYPIKDKYVTWWNPDQNSTLGNDLIAEEKGKKRRERVRFDRAANKATRVSEKEGTPRDEASYDVNPNAQDVLAGFYALREKKLDVGDHEEMPIFTGRKEFTLKVDVEGKEQVETPAGTFDTKKLKVMTEFSGKLASKREITMFVTDDGKHVPVKIEAEFLLGKVSATLTSYDKGSSW